MAKIYNEIVIDMNPESSTFEEVLHEDSFEYEGDMMLMYENYYLDTSNDGYYDTEVIRMGNTIVSKSGDDIRDHQEINSDDPTAINIQIKAVAESLASTGNYGNERVASASSGANLGIKIPVLATEDDDDLSLTLGQRGVGMGDVTATDMLGKTEDEMLQWIIDTRYGGQLPGNISENDIRSQIRTKLPQEGAITGTDWYGIQDTAADVAGAGRSIYGGMGGGMRQEIAGTKQIGKDIYALEEGKGKDWTSKFRTFLSSLPSATGTA